MGAFDTLAKKLRPLVQDVADGSGGMAELEHVLRRRYSNVAWQHTADTNIWVAVMYCPKACTVVAAGYEIETTVASSGTDYYTFELGKNITATDTAFDTQGGVSLAQTSKVNYAFTIVESTDTVAAGGTIYFKVTNTGTGPAIGGISVWVEVRLD